MNQDLIEVVKCYATRPHNELNELLLSKSKDNLISIITDLLTAYINDKNSSSLREFVTVSIAGYQHNPQLEDNLFIVKRNPKTFRQKDMTKKNQNQN
jgi:hypothetical protein